ncbi:hypothetical protein GOP47_0007575 [Adiantum capillus-veneris]|uniref:Uncharacterized protein n=1 Tax=Adiantum capillus-veneris TaxID=13818 RepID=A0A9D4V1K5_ADICA|nr:hypothetical protein GOP47_0007575 [Adiantum capillus-veneris]
MQRTLVSLRTFFHEAFHDSILSRASALLQANIVHLPACASASRKSTRKLLLYLILYRNCRGWWLFANSQKLNPGVRFDAVIGLIDICAS